MSCCCLRTKIVPLGALLLLLLLLIDIPRVTEALSCAGNPNNVRTATTTTASTTAGARSVAVDASMRATATRIAESLDLESVVGWGSPAFPKLAVGMVEAYEASPDATKPLVSWLSLLSISTETAEATTDSPRAIQDQVQLTAWCGPLTDVPHLITKLAIVDNRNDGNGSSDDSPSYLRLMIDFRPRLDAGYQDADREPASRSDFVKAGVRRDYDGAFFTPETRQWRASVLSSCQEDHGAVESTEIPQAKVFSRAGSGKGDWSQCHGPLYLDLSMPHNEGSLQTALSACTAAADRWLDWVQAASTDTDQASSWMNSRLVYDRDNQVRIELFSEAVEDYGKMFGNDEKTGRIIALADAGRLDMIGHNDIGRGEGDYS